MPVRTSHTKIVNNVLEVYAMEGGDNKNADERDKRRAPQPAHQHAPPECPRGVWYKY